MRIEEHGERAGLPSASGMQRIIECPASLPLTNQLRAAGELPVDHGSADADRGNRIHEILAAFGKGEEITFTDDMDVEDWREAVRLWEQTQELITRTFGADLSGVEVIVEERMWLNDADGNPAASGKWDLVMVDEGQRAGLVVDYKTGWGDVPAAVDNWQLRTAAVVLREAFGVTSVRVAIVQTGKAVNAATLYEGRIVEDLERIDQALAAGNADPFAVGFRPSEDRCKYCPVRLACPRLHYDLAQLQKSPLALIASATDEELAGFLDRLESVKPIDKAARSEAEARIRAGATLPGWGMAAAAGKRQVKDAAGLCRALIAAGAKVDDVLAVVSIPVGKAESIHQATTGLKGKAAVAAFSELSAAMVEKTEPEPSLKRMGKEAA